MLWWLLYYLAIVSAMSINNTKGNDVQDGVCRTKYCNQIASTILRNMNASVDPCDDFYQYACGSWKEKNPIPNTTLEWSESYITMRETRRRIKELLEQEDKPSDLEPIRKVRQFYRSCMDTEAIEKKGVEPIQRILNRYGGWPMAMPLDKWNPDHISWQKIDQHYVKMMKNTALYSLAYEINKNDTDKNILTIYSNLEFPLTRQKNLDFADISQRYMDAMSRVAKIFAKQGGYTLNETQLIGDIVDVVFFEIGLQRIIVNELGQYGQDKERDTMTIEQLQEWYNSSNVTEPRAQINFLEVIQNVFRMGNIEINASEPIIVCNKQFLLKLAELLETYPERAIVNFIHWNMVDKLLKHTTQEMRDIQFNMSYAQYNITERMPRWRSCVANIEMEHASSYLFVKKYISNESVHKAEKMFREIQVQSEQYINQTKWISDDLKIFMNEKVKNIQPQIGYPKWYNNETALIERYEGLEIGSDYFQNILNSHKYELLRTVKDFRTSFYKTEWDQRPTIVNAFFSVATDTIMIPAAIFQDPYFTPHLPDAINYGSVGFIIGHEVSHGFDPNGMKYDQYGKNVSWVSEEMSKEYQKRVQCFVDQYNSFTLNFTDAFGLHAQVNGALTQDENVADTIGIQAAFAAYNAAKAKNNRQLKLPGLEKTTEDELFFLSFANSWCSSMRPEYERNTILYETHSPADARVIGSLSNMEEFTRTFNCPANSPMNPANKCSLWK